MLIPVYGFVSGDTLGVLVLVHDQDTISTLTASLAQAASVRVRAGQRMNLSKDGLLLDPTLTVAEARLAPLQRVDLTPEGG
jgi:hypothetical protein